MIFETVHHLPLIPDVIAGGEHVDPQAEEIVGDLGSQAETSGRILAVGDYQIDGKLAA